MNKVLLKEVARRFFIGHPIKMKQHFEGQGITDAGKYVLGFRAGPEIDIGNLFHEMAHMAERPMDIILSKPSRGWGFSWGKYWEAFGKSGYEPQTEQQVLCEGRVWSYQLSLQRELGIEQNARDLVSCATYLPAFCNFSFKFKEKSPNKGYRELEKYALDELGRLVEAGTAEYSFSQFEKNWFSRMESLSN